MLLVVISRSHSCCCRLHSAMNIKRVLHRRRTPVAPRLGCKHRMDVIGSHSVYYKSRSLDLNRRCRTLPQRTPEAGSESSLKTLFPRSPAMFPGAMWWLSFSVFLWLPQRPTSVPPAKRYLLNLCPPNEQWDLLNASFRVFGRCVVQPLRPTSRVASFPAEVDTPRWETEG